MNPLSPAPAQQTGDPFRVLVEETRELLCLHDARGHFVYVSPSIQALLGYAPSELRGTDPLELVHESDRPDVAGALEAVLQGGEPPLLTARFRDASGEIRWLETQARGLRDAQGGISGLVTSSRDVGHRIALLARISNRENTLRSVLASLDDLVFVFDPSGCFREYYQPAGRGDLFAPPEAFVGRGYRECLPAEVADRLGAALDRARSRGATQEFEYELEIGGTVRTFHAKLTPMLDGGEDPGGFVGVVRDVTERRRAEEARLTLLQERARADRLEGLAALARGTAHEFNNLLTALQGNLALARADLGADHPVVPDLDAAIREGERAGAIIRRLLTYAGEQPGAFLPLDPGSLLRGLEAELADGMPARVSLEVEVLPGTPRVQADRLLVESALRQLVRNALEALGPGGGVIGLRAGGCEASAAELKATRVPPPPPPGRFAVLEVRDSGEGIDPDLLPRVLDPFVSTRFLGRGLGLSEVAGVVRTHNGALLVSSAGGEGTTFRILLPA
jgi:two-component system, cell cycle sensor histidine kinase and response regulator CckA